MPGLFTSLVTAADALGVYQEALSTINNNITNSATPGYAKQRLSTVARPFDPNTGLAGGIFAGDLESSRDQYAERAVWRNQQSYGLSSQLASSLTAIEPLFDVSGTSGLPKAITNLFKSFSSWSLAPNDDVARTGVLDSASALADQFHVVATGLNNASTATNEQLANIVDNINGLASRIAAVNKELRSDARNLSNPAIDAELHNALEGLAEYGDFTALRQSDGSVSVLLGGQTPLVMGDRSNNIALDVTGGTAAIRDANGKDITTQLSSGRLKALVDVKNTLLPQYMSKLNELAAGLADTVNGQLQAGLDVNGQPGVPLFEYNSADDAAFTIKVADITTDELAAASQSAPGGNGNTLELTLLATSPAVGGMSFMQFYSSLASRVGQNLQGAKDSAATEMDLLLQARSTRSAISSVSLDEEAANLLQFQRAYQATARVVTALNELTEVTLQML